MSCVVSMGRSRYSVKWQIRAGEVMELIRAAEVLEKEGDYRLAARLHGYAADISERIGLGDLIVERERRRSKEDLAAAEKGAAGLRRG